MQLHEIWNTTLPLIALAVPGAFARIAFQIAIDKDRPGFGFPGVLRGGVLFCASLSLAVMVGLFCAHIERTKGYEFAATICAGFLAQDLFVWMVRKGKDPLAFLRTILSILTSKK